MLLFVFSHAIADGIAGIGLLLKMVDDAPIDPTLDFDKQPAKEEEDESKEEEGVIIKKRAKKAQLGWMAKTGAFFNGIRKGFSATVPVHDPPNLLKLKAKDIFDEAQYSGNKHFARATPLDLNEIKALKNKFKDATVNDIFLALLTMTTRTFLEEKKDPILKRKNKIRGTMPVSRRKRNEALLKGGEPDNNWEPLTIRLPLKYKSPCDCVWKVKNIIDREKVSPTLIVQRSIASSFSSNFPRAVVIEQIVKATTRATLMLSNVPGPQKLVHIGGIAVEDIDFYLSSPQGTYMGVLTYNGKVLLTINSDAGCEYDPEELTAAWEKSYEALKEEVGKYPDMVPRVIKVVEPELSSLELN